MSAAAVIEEHPRGRELTAAGVRSFVREHGEGEPVVCLRGIAWDLPGLGLAERRSGFDYGWTGLGRFCHAAADSLGLERFHLVVHDVGGPVGFELAAAAPDPIASLTLLNTIAAAET